VWVTGCSSPSRRQREDHVLGPFRARRCSSAFRPEVSATATLLTARRASPTLLGTVEFVRRSVGRGLVHSSVSEGRQIRTRVAAAVTNAHLEDAEGSQAERSRRGRRQRNRRRSGRSRHRLRAGRSMPLRGGAERMHLFDPDTGQALPGRPSTSSSARLASSADPLPACHPQPSGRLIALAVTARADHAIQSIHAGIDAQTWS